MPLRVRFKATGQTGVIPEDKFDPNLFEMVDAPQAPQTSPAPTAPVEQPKIDTGAKISDDLSQNYGVLGNILGGILRPGEKYIGTVLEAGRQAIKAPENANKQKQINELLKQQSEISRNKDIPVEQKLKEVNAIADQIEALAGDITENTTGKFISDKQLQYQLEKPVEATAKNIAGMSSYFIPGGVGKNALVSGAARGAAAAYSDRDATAADVIYGAGTGGLTEGAFQVPGYLKKALGLNNLTNRVAGKTGQIMDDVGKGLETKSYIKTFGKPTVQEGGTPIFKEFDDVGINIKGSLDDLAKSADDVLSTEGTKLAQVAEELTQKGVSVKKADLLASLEKELERAKTPSMKQPIQNVIDEVNTTFQNIDDIPLDAFYQVKQEFGQLGKWNSLNPPKEQVTAAAYNKAYLKMNDLMDTTLKGNGFDDFVATNKKVSTALKAKHFAERRSLADTGTNPLGLTDVVSATAGGIITGGNPLGIAAGVGANKFLQSGMASKLSGQALQKLAPKIQAIEGMQLPQATKDILIRSLVLSASQTPKNMGSEQMSGIESTAAPQASAPEQPVPQEESGLMQITPEMLQEAKLTLSPKAYTMVKEIYDLQKEGAKEKEKKPSTSASALNAVDVLEKTFGRGNAANIGTKGDLALGGSGNPLEKILAAGRDKTKGVLDTELTQDYNIYKSQLDIVLGLLTQALGAGVPQEGEAQRLIKSAPSVTSSDREAKQWFENVRQLLKTLPPTVLTTQQVPGVNY